MTKKVQAHFSKLLKPVKLEGLMAWAEIATQLHRAKVPVLSGTLPVEIYWAGLVSMLPPSGKCVSLRSFRILAAVAFLRHNHRMFSNGSLPAWAQGRGGRTRREGGMERQTDL